MGGSQRKRERTVTFYTLTFDSSRTVHQVLRADPNRVIAYVQAGGANIVLTKSKGDAQSNVSDATYAQPHGLLLPYANAAPYPLDTTSEVWAGCASYPAQLAVTVITWAQGA
jgi:hypothetical protein